MPTPRGLVQQLDQSLHRSGLLPRGTAQSRARLLLAISGGADSIALLHLLHTINQSNYWHWTLIIAHVDHGLRGRASATDARFVKKLARQLDLPFISRKLRLPRKSSEETARNTRLKALKQMLRAKRCHAVIMAHHADDQAETLLLNLFRGAGLEGLAAMSPHSVVGGLTILRPLLNFRRMALRQYLTQLGQPWHEDATNAQSLYRRNTLRNKILPQIESLWPGAAESLTRTAQLAREAHSLLESQAADLLHRATLKRTPHRITLSRPILRTANPLLAGQALRLATQSLISSKPTPLTSPAPNFERTRHTLQLLTTPHGQKKIELGHHLTLHLTAKTLILERSW